MFFDGLETDFKIISTFELGWGKRTEYIEKRPCAALSVRVKGEADFVTKTKTYHAEKGDVAYFPPNLSYMVDARKDEHLYIIHFTAPDLPEEIEIITPKNVKVFTELFERAHRICTAKLPGFQYGLNAVFFRILEQLFIQSREENPSTDKKFSYALEYIHQNYTSPDLTIAKLSEIAGVSETYFRRIFERNLGTQPHKYINSLRLSLADELLESRYYRVKDISSVCGFSDPKYFSTLYKKERGISPSEVFVT